MITESLIPSMAAKPTNPRSEVGLLPEDTVSRGEALGAMYEKCKLYEGVAETTTIDKWLLRQNGQLDYIYLQV